MKMNFIKNLIKSKKRGIKIIPDKAFRKESKNLFKYLPNEIKSNNDFFETYQDSFESKNKK